MPVISHPLLCALLVFFEGLYIDYNSAALTFHPNPLLTHTDSWQSASAASFSPTTGGGSGGSFLGPEASLSVLGDSSVGFEPPAPPTTDRHQFKSSYQGVDWQRNADINRERDVWERNNTTNNKNNQSSSSIDGSGGGDELNSTLIAKIGGGMDFTGADNRNNGRNTSGGRNGEGGDQQSTTRPPGGNDPPTDEHTARTLAKTDHPTRRNTTDNGEVVLHGVSAAVVSGALPRATTQSNSSVGKRGNISNGHRNFQVERDGEGRRPRGRQADNVTRGRRDVENDGYDTTRPAGRGQREGGRSSAELRLEVDNDDDTGTEGLTSWRKNDGGEQARQQIDQALRERAFRRRNRFVVR